MWIVMTSTAKMPSTCWGTYRRIALVQLSQSYTAKQMRPKMIADHARGALRVVFVGRFFVGKTERCAYAKQLAEAERRVELLNNAPTVAAGDELLMSWGGSA